MEELTGLCLHPGDAKVGGGAWITERIEAYSFNEGTDFVIFSETGKNPQGGRPAKEYAITLDTAKEIAMVDNNEQGRPARLYFIEWECRAKASGPEALAALSDPAAMRGVLLVA